MIKVESKGDWASIKQLEKTASNLNNKSNFDKYGAEGVNLLFASTPMDTGNTAMQWKYEIKSSEGDTTIEFHNTNVNDGVNIAVILQSGHGTGTGGFVPGRDYITPALEVVATDLANDIFSEVTS